MKRIWMIMGLAFLMACGSDKVDNEALMNKVLDTHDEVMPKMGQLMALKKQVLAKVDSLAEADSTQADIVTLRDLALNLDNAYKGMMDWMHGWSEAADPHLKGTVPAEETTAFYNAEQKKVDKVKADINGSIAAAQEALK